MSRFDPRRYIGDTDTDILGTWDPSGLDEQARVPTGHDDVTEEFVTIADDLGASEEYKDALRRTRENPLATSAEGWGTAPGQVRDAAADLALPWWVKPLAVVAVLALLAGQFGKLLDIGVQAN